jgi:hypothetical protein
MKALTMDDQLTLSGIMRRPGALLPRSLRLILVIQI